MDQIPLWILFLFAVCFSLVAVESGFRAGGFMSRKFEAGEPATLGTMVQSTLALLAFLLAFTFGIAAERFNERRVLVIEEANAIGTTYLRAGFLPESTRKDVQELLREYVTLRLKRQSNTKELQTALVVSDKLQDKLWQKALDFGRANMDSDIGALFVETLNETIDLQSKRIAAGLYARIPPVVWAVLYALMYIGLGCIGYQAGCCKSRCWFTTGALVLSFALVLMLIADLDRPSEGFLRTSLRPMQDLAIKIGAALPAD